MTPKAAADLIRPHFKLPHISPDMRREYAFTEAVADELGVERTVLNMLALSDALHEAGVTHDRHDYPKHLYRKALPDGVTLAHFKNAHYDPRHDHICVMVADDNEEHALDDGWVDDPAKLRAVDTREPA